MGTAENVLKVRRQRSRSRVQECEFYNGGGIHFDSVVQSRLTCLCMYLLAVVNLVVSKSGIRHN